MADFCLDCWNKINDRNDPPDKYVLSREPELCEECGEYKRVIIMERKHYGLLFTFMDFIMDLFSRVEWHIPAPLS